MQKCAETTFHWRGGGGGGVRKGGGLCFSLPGLLMGEREEMIRRSQWGRDREEKEVKGERGGPTALLFMPALEQRAYNGLRPQHHS